MPRQLTLPIVGVDFPNLKGPTRRFALDLLRPGDPVELRPEPKNPADRNAIAIYSAEGVQVGYLPAERAPFIGGQIARGDVAAIFQGKGSRGGFVRIGLDGVQPTLPPPSDQAVQGEPEWYPDDIWPDD